MSEPDAIAIRPSDAPSSSSALDETEQETEIERLEAEIAVKRERVVASIGELRRRVDRATNWRQWVGAHPVAFIGAALCAGFILGYRRGDSRRP